MSPIKFTEEPDKETRRLMHRTCLAIAFIAAIAATGFAPQTTSVKPLPQAHAHNDYLHKRPLLDALSHGFCSVEADIFLVEEQLLVAHFKLMTKKGRNLRSLYLDPLKKLITANKGTVYANNKTPLTLLIDIKDNGVKTYAHLHKVLSDYREMLTRVEDGKLIPGAVTVIISGDRPMTKVAKSNPRYCGIDGRLSDLNTDKSSHLMPLISDHWGRNFKWKGKGPMPEAERKKLHTIVEKAHTSGRRVRFWATPENEELWKELRTAKVDMLNTDNLAAMQTFLSKSFLSK